jgi:hypothetical protein
MTGDMLYKRGEESMQKTWLALACVAAGVCIPSLFAAEKNRDWQSGQVVESKGRSNDPRIHAIAGPDKTYIVRGSIGGGEDALAVGATVRFAIQGTTMYLSIEGSEYRLAVLGATVKPALATPAAGATSPPTPPPPPPPPVPTASAPTAPAPAPVPKNAPSAPPTAAVDKPPAKASQPSPDPALDPALDNDAIVKMIVGGLKEDTVISVIEARPGKYALTSDALAALKAAGVPQRVMAAMSAKMGAQH